MASNPWHPPIEPKEPLMHATPTTYAAGAKTRRAPCRSVVAVVAAVAAGLLLCLPAAAGDWPAWRGPDRTGISEETGWRTDWKNAPPDVLWQVDVGEGFSTVSVVGDRVYTMGNDGGVDTVWCLSAEDGKPVWRHRYPCQPHQYKGPRCTPTVDGDRVYTLSNRGHLFCLDAASGQVKWLVEVPTRLRAEPPRWGFACSPLVLGDRLIIDVGPIAALDKMTGKVLWQAGSDEAGYASPMAFEHGGKTLLASFNAHGPIVVDAAEGEVLARERWKTSYNVNAVTPIIKDDTMFISSGYGVGAALFKVADGGLEQVWKNRNMRNHANNCVLWDGHLYGFDGQVNAGPLTCIDYETGEKRWSEPTLKAGGLMLADGVLICMTASGDCVLVKASPEACTVLGRKSLFTKKDTCWTHPVLAGGRIWCRTQSGHLACLDVRKK
jgi:outer membrane protein assembly factor BamB